MSEQSNNKARWEKPQCHGCIYARQHRGHGENWMECVHPRNGRAAYENILEKFDTGVIPEWCPRVLPQGFALELAMRQDFERRCMDHFNAKRAAGVKIIDDNGAPATPEALFWKNPDGSYGVQAFNVAWVAYRWGFEASRGMGV